MTPKTLSDFNGDMPAYQAWKKEFLAWRSRPRPKQIEYVPGPERVVVRTVEKRVEVPVEVDRQETLDRLTRAEADLQRAENVLAKAQQVPPEPVVKDAPPEGFEDLRREDEPWSETADKLAAELVELRNKMMLNVIDEEQRARMDRLERLFRPHRPKFEQAG